MSIQTAPSRRENSKASRRTYWSSRLARTVHVRDGKSIATLAEARAFVLDLPEHYQTWAAWQETTRLLLEAAENGRTEAVTDQLECALLTSVMLDVRKTQ